MDSTLEQLSHRVVNDIIAEDFALDAKIYKNNIQVSEIYSIFRQRISLYEKAISMPLVESDRLLLNFKKAEICMELRMFKFKQDILSQLGEVQCRIDVIEDKYQNQRKDSSLNFK